MKKSSPSKDEPVEVKKTVADPEERDQEKVAESEAVPSSPSKDEPVEDESHIAVSQKRYVAESEIVRKGGNIQPGEIIHNVGDAEIAALVKLGPGVIREL
jgi:hypothetical protein